MSRSPLAEIEPRLRHLVPARIYAAAWVDPCKKNLTAVFNHLRTLQYILYDYVPRHVSEELTSPGQLHYHWQEGALMFTDLAGFTRLMEVNANRGQEGALMLLDLLNNYFSAMIETLGYSGGALLEFTGDALLAVFQGGDEAENTARAVRAGLRMQRMMARFAAMVIEGQTFSLKMRVGLHVGRFLSADIGTPRRAEHVLLGLDVHRAKLSESAGQVDRVNLTPKAYELVTDRFRFEEGKKGHWLVVDDFADDELGEYEVIARRRLSTPLLLDRSVEGIVATIQESLAVVERLASYLPGPVLNLLVENASERQIPPDFPATAVLFVSLLGVPEAIHEADEDTVAGVVLRFSGIFALINAAVEAQGGVLKKVTYHLAGSDVVIYFGSPIAHTNDPVRAARAALAIRNIVNTARVPGLEEGQRVPTACQIGITFGPTFSGEIGEPRGRREYNVLGPIVNTSARLMNRAEHGQILMTQEVYNALGPTFHCDKLPAVSLKGMAQPTPIYALLGESER